MTVTLEIAGGTRYVAPADGQPFAIAAGACPGCSATPFRVRGLKRRRDQNDRDYVADAVCCDCAAPVGLLRARMDTFFGLAEDEAVLEYGRGRVYG